MDEFKELFAEPPDANEKAWGLIHDVMHHLLTHNNKMYPKISPKTPILKIVELLHDNGFDLKCEIVSFKG